MQGCLWENKINHRWLGESSPAVLIAARSHRACDVGGLIETEVVRVMRAEDGAGPCGMLPVKLVDAAGPRSMGGLPVYRALPP